MRPRRHRRSRSRTGCVGTWADLHYRCVMQAGCQRPSEPAEEPGDRLADLGRGVLLQEVAALDGDLLLIRPRATEVARSADEDRAGVAVDAQLGQGTAGEPPRVLVDERRHVGRLAVDRDLAWPRERRAPGLARLAERL